MKNILCVSALLLASIGYSQNKVTVKSAIPTEEVILVKIPVSEASTTKNKMVEKMDTVIEKQKNPVENVIINHIGIQINAEIEPVLIQKRKDLF